MSCRFLVCVLAFALAAGAARAQDANPGNSAVWNKVHDSVFAGAAIEAADNVVALETPMRAEDAAIVPVAIRSRFAQGTERFIETIWLIVDNNPSPIAAVFHFTPDSGRADMETRIRVEQYTHRACGRQDERRQAVHGSQLRQGVGGLLGTRRQGCGGGQGGPRQDAHARRRCARSRASPRSRN